MKKSLLLIAVPLLLFLPTEKQSTHLQHFSEPIDALSVHFPHQQDVISVRAKEGNSWGAWKELHVENEQDPTLQESNLIMFQGGVTDVEFSKPIDASAVHPITVSHEPAHYLIAAKNDPGMPHILSREEWGADDSLLYTSKIKPKPASSASSAAPVSNDNGDNVSEREADCMNAQKNFPDEFKTERTERKDANGKTLRWPRQYSKEINLLVVHHTAITVTGDARTGAEKVRALYTYHADNRGWGDIGYHYVIDDEGQIYEGKSGGKLVVAGHAYCHNVDTIGIAMLGNFDIEKPTQVQMKSLQWLLSDLSKTYNIDPSKNTEYHGATLPPIVGHGDLLKTDCPGYYVKKTLDQVRSHVITEKLSTGIDFPVAPRIFATSSSSVPYVSNADKRLQKRIVQGTKGEVPIIREGVSPLGSNILTGRPADTVRFSVRFIAGKNAFGKRSEISSARLEAPTAALWQVIDGVDIPISDQLIAPEAIPTHGSILLQLKVLLPINAGTTSLTFGDTEFQLVASGKRQLGARGSEKIPTQVVRSQVRTRATSHPSTSLRASRPPATSSVSSATSSSSISSTPSSSSQRGEEQFDSTQDKPAASSEPTSQPFDLTQGKPANEPTIRILLSYWEEIATVSVNGGTPIVLSADQQDCVATKNNAVINRGIVRIDGHEGTVGIDSWNRAHTHFRGIIECRVIDGQLTLINEVSLEDYMFGIGEEPDTELYEKQRAFAIAARTYAAYYTDPAHRKFKGMPYDGSDSAASFQRYEGADFADENRRWVNAVKSTKNQVLTVNGEIIKPPYFSSDDGRTRTPAEAKWGNFPFAEIFSSKPDPWCEGMKMSGHGVGMSGCGAKGQAKEGKTAEEILQYYYPGTTIEKRSS